MNKMINRILGNTNAPKQKRPRRTQIIILGVNHDTHETLCSKKCNKEDVDKNVQEIFNLYPDASIVNVVYLNGRVKIIHR